MKFKKTPKLYWGENDVECYDGRIKLVLGYIIWYIHKNTKGFWNYEVYWYNPDTGSDTTLEFKKNQKFSDKEEAYNMIVGVAQHYFEEYPLKVKIEQNINKLEESYV